MESNLESNPEPVPEIFKGKVVCKCCIDRKNISFIISEKKGSEPINNPIDNTKSS